MTGLVRFLNRKRFPVRDFLSLLHVSEETAHLATRLTSRVDYLLEFGGVDDKGVKLRRAIALAEFLSHNGDPQDPRFIDFLPRLMEDEWRFVLRFSRFYKLNSRLDSAEQSVEALGEIIIGLESCLGEMSATTRMHGWRSESFDRLLKRAAMLLHSMLAQHSTFIDISRTLLLDAGLSDTTRSRAVRRVSSRTSAEHAFFSGLRNFALHYALPLPHFSISKSDTESLHLDLHTSELLQTGFRWKPAAREYLLSHKTGTIDILTVAHTVFRNLEKQVEFCHRASKRLNKEDYSRFTGYQEAWERSRTLAANRFLESPNFKASWRKKRV